MLRAVGALSIAVLAACAQPAARNALPGVNDRNSLLVTLVRTTCYGTCPMYGVEIRGDGSATYCGIHFVNEVGERKRQVSEADISQLVAQFQAADFFALKDEYAADVTDNPTYKIAIAYDGKSKSVMDYVGQQAGMPKSVASLEEAVDRIAQTEKWVGKGDGGYANEWPACAAQFGFQPPEKMPPIPL